MSKVKIVVRDLDDVQVSHVSLVKRGASRIPFRIIKREKEENTMLDLSSLFIKKRDKAPEVPTLVGVVLAKGEYDDSLLDKLKELGLTGTVDQSQDNATLIKAEGYETAQDVAGIQMKNGMVAVYANLKKGLSIDPESMFGDVVKVNSVYPSVSVACSTFQDMLWDALYENSDKGSTMVDVGSLLDDLKNYILGVLDTIPDTLYKMEKLEAVAKTDKPAEQTTEETKTVEGEVTKTEEQANSEQSTVDKTAEVTTEATKESEVAKADKQEQDEQSIDLLKSEFSGLKETIETLVSSVAALSTNVTAQVAELNTRIEKAEGQSNSALEILNGKVSLTTNEDSLKTSVDVLSKTESVFDGALLFPGFEIH
jgi:hypothetical protein